MATDTTNWFHKKLIANCKHERVLSKCQSKFGHTDLNRLWSPVCMAHHIEIREFCLIE